MTRVLRAVRNVNQLITREKDRHTLLRRACEIFTETRGYRSAWIGLGNADGLMKVVAESGIGEAFAATRAEWERTGWPACARQALAGGEVAVLHDPKTDCSQCPLSLAYRDSAALAAPMRHEGRDYGVLVVALPRAAADDVEERSLLAEAAGDLAFALHAIEAEDRHRAAEAREAHLKQVLLAIRNVNQLIVHEDDPRRLIDRACRDLTETLGYDNAWIALLGGEAARGLGLPEAGPVAAAAAGGSGDACDSLVERLVRGEFTACMRRALAATHVIVEGDPPANCPDCPLRNAYGARAGFARRLDFEGVTYGILAVSVPSAYAQNDAEHDLFNEVADDLAFALHKIAAARRLDRTRRRYREIFENSRDGFVMVDSVGKILDANEAYCAMLGYTLDELRALPDFYAITPERWHAWEKDEIWQKRLLGQGASGLYEKEYIRKDGVVFPVELQSYVVRREDGEVDYLWKMARDITERKQGEAALERQHTMLARAEALAHVGSWEWDIAADRVRWSDELFRIFGRDPDRGAPSFAQHPELYLPEDMSRLREAVRRCVSQGTPYELDLSAIRSDGEIRHCVARGQAEADEAGRIVGLAGSLEDLTEHKKLVREIENQRRRLESLMNAIPAPVFFKDKDGRYVGCNPAFEALTGRTAAQIAGKTVHDLWPEKYDATYRDKDLELLESGGMQQYEFKLANAQGEERNVVFHKAAFRGPSGEIDGLVGVILDVTERKEAEEALKQSERVMRYIIKHDPNALAVYDTELRYIAVSGRYLEDYGVAEADILGKHHYEVFPEMPQRWKEVHQRVLAGATERNDDDSFERPDGSITYNRWECRPWYRADGSIGGMITYTEVTTERKLAEIALLESEERYRRYIESSPSGVFVCDDNGRYLQVNPAASLITGYSQDELTAMCIADLLLEDDRDAGISHFDTLVRQGSSDGELPYRHKNGERRWWSVSAVRLSDSRFLGFCTDVTERKKAEEALRYSENLFRRVFDLLPVGLWIADKNGTLLRGNPAGVRIWGAEPHVPQDEYGVFKARRLPSGEEIEPDDWALAHTVNEGITVVDELLEIEAFDGVKRVIMNYTAPVTDESGRVLAAVIVNWDITDQYRAEQALEERERNYRLLADNTLDVIWLMDMELRFIYVNPAILAMTGYTVSEWVGTRLPDHCDQEGFGRMAAVIEAEVAKGPHSNGVIFESTMRRKDGTSLSVEIHGKVIFDDTGAPQFLQGVTRDIGERRQMEGQNQLLADIVNRSQDFIGVADLDQRAYFVNPAGQALVGLDSDEAVAGTVIRDYFLPEDVPYAESTILPAVMKDGRWAGEFRLRHFKTGKPVPVLFELFRARNPETGAITDFATITRDITDRKQAEEERQRLNAQIQQAQKMESVGRLAGGVAHDFNNMLNVILGNAELMSDNLPDHSPLREDLDEIRKAAERSANLTRQLLAFARKQTIAPKDLDLNDTIASMLKMLQRLIGEDIELLWKPGASLHTVRIDPGQVDQILANLTINARDAIAHAHGRITIETANVCFDEAYCADHPDCMPGDCVMLAISDNGCGMDEDTLASIFEPFFTTKGVGEGTGLGLSTVFGIVKQNNGSINAYSEPGQGTTLKVYFPALFEAGARPAIVETGPNTGDETIVLVEDQPALLKMARNMLEHLGYTVLVAATPGEALRLAREHSGGLDLLVTDVVMPEMNGRELAQQLQALRPGLKTLFMSGYTVNVIVHQGVLDVGVNFIEKPFSRRDLARKVREVLDGD